MKSFRQELLESIETFEDAKNVVSEWLMGGVELETTKLKLYENMYLTKKAIDILDLRNSIIEKVNVALQSLSKIAITEADNIMTETYDKSIKSIKESIDKSLTVTAKTSAFNLLPLHFGQILITMYCSISWRVQSESVS